MSTKRERYPAEYKREAVRRVIEGGESTAKVADSLGVGHDSMYRWVREFRRDSKEAFRGNGTLTSQDEEIRHLRGEVSRLREENAILEKATVFFARKPR